MKTVFYLVMQSSTISFLGELFALISQIQKAREKRGKSSLVLGPSQECHSQGRMSSCSHLYSRQTLASMAFSVIFTMTNTCLKKTQKMHVIMYLILG